LNPQSTRHPIHFERQLLLDVVLAALPGFGGLAVLLLAGRASAWFEGLVALLAGIGTILAIRRLRRRIVHVLHTLSNALAALREGDFSLRVRGGRAGDALGELVNEVNNLGAVLLEQRSGAVEAQALLRVVLAEIDVALFAFDEATRLRLTNRAGERLLGRASAEVIGKDATELGLAGYLEAEPRRVVELSLPGGAGRWGLRRTTFREGGRQHQLLVLADLSRTLREEERAAWQRLLRVLGHELNNTLAPIRSIAGSLRKIVDRRPLPEDWQADVVQGLTIIAASSESLHHFLEGYSRLARLPQPQLAPVDLGEAVRVCLSLETRLTVQLAAGPAVTLRADRDQLGQLLLNLVKNAVEAALETGGGVTLGWQVAGNVVEIRVTDEGPGIANPANLFVPFFTTKPEGSGIGLVLSRQIAEAHGGSLDLKNRPTGTGSEALLRLPRE